MRDGISSGFHNHFFLLSKPLKIIALAIPITVLYLLDRPVARMANELTGATFEYGVLVTVLDMAVFVVLGGLSVYVAVKIWRRA